MTDYMIIPLIALYLLGLFFIAYNSERYFSRLFNNGRFYALSLMVYCSAWTFYGSVGSAAKDGLSFLSIYIGPLITVPFWWILLRKMARVTRTLRISSIADFISVRYGKHANLGKLVAFTSLLAVIPYIALQLKAIDKTVLLVSPWAMPWASYLVFVLLIVFAILFGAANVDANQRKPGLISAIAFESIVKLIAFLAIGIYVVYGLFNGFSDLFTQATERINFEQLTTLPKQGGISDWFFMSVVSGIAFLLLPRQFQVSAVEIGKENHIISAMKIVPVYLFLINLFVVPIALAGLILLPEADSDYYVLLLPLKENASALVALVFLGGFSAATGMILVSTTALSTMLSNYIFIPLILKTRKEDAALRTDYQSKLLFWRRASIFIIMFLAYAYFKTFTNTESLIGIGYISFIAIAQLAPSFFGGLFWQKANSKAAIRGIIIGLLIWIVFFIYPNMVHAKPMFQIYWLDELILQTSSNLGMSVLSCGILLSLGLNSLIYIVYAYLTKQSATEVNQAELFVNIFKYSGTYDSSLVRKVSALLSDIKSLFQQFIGEKRTNAILDRYARENGIDWETNPRVDAQFVTFSERVLTGIIGPSSARIMVSKVVQEEEISMDEVMDILQESQEIIRLNKQLVQQREQLSKAKTKLQVANDKLLEYGELKNEFLYTVTHELRTPITSIRAMGEILRDNEDMDEEQQKNFLQNIVYESERMSRLISNVLDLEKFESGNQAIEMEEVDLTRILKEEIKASQAIIANKEIDLDLDINSQLDAIKGDADRVRQLLNNLLTNAIKYCDAEKGKIKITGHSTADFVHFSFANNGSELTEEDVPQLFDKFYQVKNQKRKRQVGHGLGLAISKNIIEMLNGEIDVELEGNWVNFTFKLPKYKENE